MFHDKPASAAVATTQEASREAFVNSTHTPQQGEHGGTKCWSQFSRKVK